MNIIPFIISLLLIIAISTNTLLKKKITEDLVSKSISGYMNASRKALNNSEYYFFESIQEKPIEKSKDKKTTKEKVEKKRAVNIENAKINIYPIVVDRKENQPELYNLVLSLMHTLYCDKSFYYPNFEKEILNNILSAIDIQLKNDKDLHLSNLIFKDSFLQKKYYKILKGTKFYDFDNNIGVPSLLDYIKFENTNSKISMKDASFELLVTIFSISVAKELNELQKQDPPKNLTKQNVINICQKHSFRFNENILDFFDFSISSKNSKEKIIVGLDKETNIKVKRKLNLN